MSVRPRERYGPTRGNPDTIGTPSQRRAYWQIMVGGDAYDLGYANGMVGKDRDGLCLGPEDDRRKVKMPDAYLVRCYKRGWKRGHEAAEAHAVSTAPVDASREPAPPPAPQ